MTGDESWFPTKSRERSWSPRKGSKATDEQPSPTSGSGPLISTGTVKRKRGASFSRNSISESREKLSIAPEASLTTRPVDSPSQICLCQPDPKVPRPRNAFILYRQHHQAKVVAENPGLANPEISKIIGDQWRSSAPEVKQHWKGLAEEEKLRHQKQYPDYRYQPRRGRHSVATTLQPGQTSPRCQKCGGKSMATPYLPSPGFQRVAPNTGAIDSSFHQYPTSAIFPRTPHGIPSGYSLTPRTVPAWTPHPVPLTTRAEDCSPDMASPEGKRRCYEPGAPVNSHYPSRTAIEPSATRPANDIDRLPRHELFGKGVGFGIAPPPHPSHVRRHDSRQEPVILAPLKIKSPLNVNRSRTQSIEAMVMSIKPLAKIKTLAKISRPLQKPGPTSPSVPIRGAVVAIEGSDENAMESVAKYVRDDLERYGEHVVRAWASPDLEVYGREPSNVDILQLMTHWHGISNEVIKYITTVPEVTSLESPISPKTKWTLRRGTQRTMSEDGSNVIEQPSPNDGARSTNVDVPVPVALIPNYQLTTTDRAASQVAISDSYSPIDHWQWVAALWRGTVGPDVVICIRAPHDVDGIAAGSPSGDFYRPQQHEHHQVQHAVKPKAAAVVDVRLEEARTVLVRCEKNSEVSEQSLRRVAFEVGEWLRGRDERERRRGSV